MWSSKYKIMTIFTLNERKSKQTCQWLLYLTTKFLKASYPKKKSSWKLLPPLPFRMNSEIFSKASPQPRSYRRRDEEIWKAWLEMSQLSRCVPTSFMRPTNQSQQSVSTAGWWESYCTRRTNCPFTLGRCSASLFRLWYLTCKKKKIC